MTPYILGMRIRLSPRFICTLAAFASVLCAGISGCGTSPLARYPDFPVQKTRYPSTVILADAVIIHAVLGDTEKVDIPENAGLGRMCLNMLAGRLNDKGYHVDRTLLSSIGMLMNPDKTYKVLRTPADVERDIEELDAGSPPFFVDEVFKSDTALRRNLQGLYLKLSVVERGKGDSSFLIPEGGTIGRRVGGGLMCVILVGGYNVPAASQSGQYHGPPTLEKVTVQHVTQMSARLFFLDSMTGEVLWDDRVAKIGGLVMKEKIAGMLEDLLEEIP